jgi:hypothetical protein
VIQAHIPGFSLPAKPSDEKHWNFRRDHTVPAIPQI